MPKSKKKSNKETKEKDGDSEKPLPKLVLKVAKEHKKHHKKSEGEGADNTERVGEHSHHKKKKKKHHKHQDRDKDQEKEKEKKSRKREHSVAETTQNEPPVKKLRNKDKEKKADKVDKEIPPFRLCLENLLRNLQRKDVYNIFQFPVSDAVAPGYSKVIKKPMDFMTMSQKIEKDEYTSIEEMKADFLLMCSNAMLYNGPDTIYYKSADKMLSIGLKTLSKEKMHKVSKSLGLAVSDSEDDVVHVEDTDVNVLDSVNTEEESPAPKQRKSERKKKSKEKDREHKNMLESILAASHAARQKLLQKYPDQLYGYISKDKASGNQSFNILNPDATEDTRTREVTLGNVAPPPQAGIPAGQVTKEDKKNRVVPVNYLLYGPFGSFGPSYDSSLSNTTKEESDLLLQTYGSDLGVSYRNSVHEFTNEASCLTGFVDRLLDTITNGAHSKFVKKQKEAEQEEANKENKERTVLKKKAISETQTNTTTTLPTPPTSNANNSQPSASTNVETTPEVDLESLLTLDDLGIDVSFIKDIVGNKEDNKKQTDEKPSDTNVSTKFSAEDVLTKNAELLDSLQKKQNARLSSKYGGTQPIDAEELNIATSLTNNLKEIMKVTKPVDVVPTDAVKRAIGSENYVPEEQKAEAETTPSITENQQQGKTTEAVQAIS